MAYLQFCEARLARERALALGGAIRRFGERGREILYCKGCGAPVVNSGPGRLRHAQRSTRCKEAMEL